MRGGFELDDHGRLPGLGFRPIRDFIVGLGVFLALMAAVHWGTDWLAPSKAAASELLAHRMIDVTAPAGAMAENAILAVARPRAVLAASDVNLRLMAVLGVTFSLMFAANAAFYRHVRQVRVAPRKGD